MSVKIIHEDCVRACTHTIDLILSNSTIDISRLALFETSRVISKISKIFRKTTGKREREQQTTKSWEIRVPVRVVMWTIIIALFDVVLSAMTTADVRYEYSLIYLFDSRFVRSALLNPFPRVQTVHTWYNNFEIRNIMFVFERPARYFTRLCASVFGEFSIRFLFRAQPYDTWTRADVIYIILYFRSLRVLQLFRAVYAAANPVQACTPVLNVIITNGGGKKK